MFKKCLINYLGLSYEQTVMWQLYLLVKHCIFTIEIVVVYYDLFDIHDKLSIVVMSKIKLIPTPSWLVYFGLKAQPFFINFGVC